MKDNKKIVFIPKKHINIKIIIFTAIFMGIGMLMGVCVFYFTHLT